MSLQTQLQKAFEGKIDFEGQKLANAITQYVLIFATMISFLVGVVSQSLRLCFGVFSFATVVLALIVVPPWPLFNKHPVKWLPARRDSKKSQ
ncbi:hypothetical protein M422DRAFT_244360 [Sphaerobolus stellatus SS14]|nr:hypothetical protein M422DRAFT_244360 [Sphaerobolus stellatus SS14]